MAEIAFMKLFKIFLQVGSYFGGGIFFLNKITEGEIMQHIPVNNPLQNVAAAMFIAMIFVNIIIKIVDKRLEWKERNLKMESDREDLDYKKKKNGGSK